MQEQGTPIFVLFCRALLLYFSVARQNKKIALTATKSLFLKLQSSFKLPNLQILIFFKSHRQSIYYIHHIRGLNQLLIYLFNKFIYQNNQYQKQRNTSNNRIHKNTKKEIKTLNTSNYKHFHI